VSCEICRLKKCLTHIRAVLEQAVDDDELAKNPAKKAHMPAYRKPSERFLTVDECKKLLAAASNERDLMIVMLLTCCALRPSELFALRVDDVLPGMLRIDEAVVLGNVGDTKTEDSSAIIPMPPPLEAALGNYIRTSGVTDLLFPSAAGTPMSHENYLTRILKPLGAAAGIKGLNHQILRRTAATHFQKHGRPKDAQGFMRHANAQTTLDNYMKILDSRVASAVSGLFNELIGDAANPARKLVN